MELIGDTRKQLRQLLKKVPPSNQQGFFWFSRRKELVSHSTKIQQLVFPFSWKGTNFYLFIYMREGRILLFFAQKVTFFLTSIVNNILLSSSVKFGFWRPKLEPSTNSNKLLWLSGSRNFSFGRSLNFLDSIQFCLLLNVKIGLWDSNLKPSRN